MNQDKALLQVLRGERVSPPPIWLMRQAGRYLPEYRKVRATQPDFISFCLNPEAASEVTLQPIRRYGFDASIVFADILLTPMALGQKVWFVKGEGPKLEAVDPTKLNHLSTTGAMDHLAPVGETLSILRRELPASCTLIGFAGSPWTVATYMVEGAGSKDKWEVRQAAWKDPARFDDLLGLLIDVTTDYLIMQAKAGAEVLKLFDSWAEGLPDPLFDRVIIKPTRAIIEKVRAAGIDAPIIGFPRGAGPNYVAYAEETGITGLALDHGVSTRWAVNALPRDLPVQGQLDPAALKVGGSVLAGEVQRLLGAWKDRPYIFNLGHGITPDVPPEHVDQLIALVRAQDQ